MARHERIDHDYTDQTVFVEQWSGKLLRFEKRWHCWQFVEQADDRRIARHDNAYDSYGEMPVGSVVVIWYFPDDPRIPDNPVIVRHKADGFWERVA